MNVPKLRFKEFSDEYKYRNLSDISTLIKDGTHGTHENYENGIPLLSAKDINNNKINIPENCRKISVDDYNKIYKNYLLKKDDILLTIVGSIGRTALYKNEKVAFQRSVATIRIDDNNNSNYIRQYIESPMIINQLNNMTNSSAQGGVYLSSLSKLNFDIPRKEEQLKIANFLSLLDKKIELQSKKIEDLKLFKKGLINILNKKSYQETTLGKIGKFQTSSIDKLVKENEKIVNLYNYMDVYKHKIIMTQDLSKLSKTSAKDNQIITNNLKRGDILFTPSSETPDDIGHSICIQENLPNTVYSYHLLRYRPNIIIDPLFSNYYFNNSKIRKQIIRYATGATRYTVSLDNFLKIKVDIPDLITQKKYGLLLYSTDKKVNKEMFKLNKLQELKKGLMQDMFV